MSEPMGEAEMLDRITITGISGRGYHGVLPEERRRGQVFLADVTVHLDTRPAAEHDDLARTVNYAELAQDVVAVLEGEPVDLVETLAQRIADRALVYPGVEVVDVVVHKPEAPVPVPFDDVRVAVRRRRARPAPDPLEKAPEGEVDVVLALGANLGDAAATLRHAVSDLDAAPGLRVTGVSPLARTVAVGPAQEDYLNAVIAARTSLSPRELHRVTSAIEDAHGRVRRERWGPRTLDIDVVAVDGVTSADPTLTLPHPRARERAFVLLPWSRLDPAAVLPGAGAVRDLARSAQDADGLTWVAEDWWHRGEAP